MGEGAFTGVRVVELAQWVFVPVAGALLADWGADVVRIERPEGDPYRGLMTQGIGTDGGGGVNLSIALANRGSARLAKKDADGALKDLSEALRLNPTDSLARETLEGWLSRTSAQSKFGAVYIMGWWISISLACGLSSNRILFILMILISLIILL